MLRFEKVALCTFCICSPSPLFVLLLLPSENFLSRIFVSHCSFVMALLDSKAQYLARAKEIGISAPCVDSLHNHGIDSLGALAFAVGTTPGECSSQDF